MNKLLRLYGSQHEKCRMIPRKGISAAKIEYIFVHVKIANQVLFTQNF